MNRVIAAYRHLLRRFRGRVHIELTMGDITTMDVDAVVNAAKASLLGGGGVDGAIHAAGGPAILKDCKALRAYQYPNGLPVGEAVVTTAGRMHADWVIHTVGPVYDPAKNQSALLRSCYTSALAVADNLGARTIAFPLISAGVYGWPIGDAIHQALAAIRAAKTSVETVWLVLYDESTYRQACSIYLDRHFRV
jgi:O-acetyl-ADP-ribose deacetylase (regulator of RNase III)